MGNIFSCLTRCVQIRTNELVPNVNALRNDEKVDAQENECENSIRTQDSVCCNDSEPNGTVQNRNKVVKGKPAINSASSATYNERIRDHIGNVMVSSCDNNNIVVVKSGQHMGSMSEVDAPPTDTANQSEAPLDEEIQISTTTPVAYIIAIHGNTTIIGDGNEIKVPYESKRAFNFDSRVAHHRLESSFDETNDKTNAETSFHGQLFATPYRLPSPGVSPQLAIVFEQMTAIVNELYPLRDRGKWKEFDESLSLLQSEYESQTEIKCFLMLEKSVRLTYRKRLEEGRKMAEDALRFVNKELDGLSRKILRLFGNVALASMFRREGEEERKLGSACKCLEKAKQSGVSLRGINSTIPKFALALLNYEQGRLWSEFAKMTLKPEKAQAEARKFLGYSIDRCRELSEEDRLYIARQGFALIDLACLSVPRSSASKKPSVKRTKCYLKEFSRTHNQVEDTPIAAKIKFFMTKSKLCLLAGKYPRAGEHARQALNIAKQYGFDLEIVPAQNQIDRCHSSASLKSQAELQVKRISSKYACNSTTTTDSDQTASRSD